VSSLSRSQRPPLPEGVEALLCTPPHACGPDFFERLCAAIAEGYGVMEVLVARRLERNPKRVRTLAHWRNGGAAELLDYDLAGTPCGRVGTEEPICTYPSGVAQAFPEDADLAAMGAEGYCGAAFYDDAGSPLGHVAAIHSAEIREPGNLARGVAQVAIRVGLQLDHLRLRRQLDDRTRLLTNIDANLPGFVLHGRLGGPEGFCFEYVSPQVSAFLGVTAADLMANPAPLLERVLPEDQQRIQQAMTRGPDPDLPRESSTKTIRIDLQGEERVLRLASTAVRGPDGQIEFFSFAQDVSELERAEEALRRSEEKLRAAQKMEALGELAGGVAHDFNNLLTAIRGFAELALAEAGDDASFRPDLEEVLRSAERARELTHRLLLVGRRELSAAQPLDLREILAEAEPLLTHSLGSGIELRNELDAIAGSVRADRASLEQVIVNLALNARDAMPTGGVLSFSGGLERAEDLGLAPEGFPDGQCVVLRVTDTGRGMDAEQRERAFEPFFTTRPTGTGLGLSTATGIVERLGGRIELASEPGVGTTFTVILPHHPETPLREPNAEPAPVQGGGETILVAEDEHLVRRFVIRTLRDLGYQVIETRDGEEALQRLRAESHVHLLLTDVVMPGMSGTELARIAEPFQPKMACLYMTGFTHDDDINDHVRGADARVLLKPFSRRDLAQRIREILDARS